jgi:hypothetical protein
MKQSSSSLFFFFLLKVVVCFGVFVAVGFVTISVAVACIYRKDLPRVTKSRNRLGLSLSKRIRHGLIAKINGKRRSRACEALGRISADYSRARRVPVPHHAPPRRGERAHACFPLSSLLHTLVSA